MGSTTTPIRIIIVGAGLGGLAAANCLARKGHKVQVLERNNGLSEFGAGLQVTPNAVRLLYNWGLGEALQRVAFVPRAVSMRRYSTGELLGQLAQNPESEEDYGFPYLQIYRPDFQRVLAEGLKSLGVQIDYGKKVAEIDAEVGAVRLEDGSTLTGDLVICADGINSRCRQSILGDSASRPQPLPEYNYRAIIPRSQMMQHPDTAHMISTCHTHAFMGPERAIIAYPISGGQLFNLAVIVPRESDAPIGGWNMPGDVLKFRRLFSDFCPIVQELVGLVKSCAKWTIAEMPSLKSWISPSSRVVLLGDAAHAMSPHAAQGSAMAIEDAAVLGECLAHFLSLGELPQALEAYEAIRKPRVERVAEVAKQNGKLWVLPDGPQAEARDRAFKDMMAKDEESKRNTSQNTPKARPIADMNAPWPKPEAKMWLYGYDAIAEVGASKPSKFRELTHLQTKIFLDRRTRMT